MTLSLACLSLACLGLCRAFPPAAWTFRVRVCAPTVLPMRGALQGLGFDWSRDGVSIFGDGPSTSHSVSLDPQASGSPTMVIAPTLVPGPLAGIMSRCPSVQASTQCLSQRSAHARHSHSRCFTPTWVCDRWAGLSAGWVSHLLKSCSWVYAASLWVSPEYGSEFDSPIGVPDVTLWTLPDRPMGARA